MKKTITTFLFLFSLIYPISAYAEKSNLEKEVNPFGDEWAVKTNINSNIPVAFSTCYYGGLRGSWPDISEKMSLDQEELAYISKLSSPFVIFDQCPALGKDGTKYKTFVSQIKNTNNQLKVIGYLSVTRGHPQQAGYENLKEEWFVHKSGFPPTLENRLAQGETGFMMNVTNSEYQEFIAQKIADTLAEYNLDGFLDDHSSFSDPHYVCKCDPILIPDNVKSLWFDGLQVLFQKIKERIGPTKYHFYNNYSLRYPDAYKASDQEKLLQYADGIFLEDGGFKLTTINFTSQSPEFLRLKEIMEVTKRLDKYFFFFINSGAENKYSETNPELEAKLSKYYLAWYLLFSSGDKTPLIYLTPTQFGDTFMGSPYFATWDAKIGLPISNAQEISPQEFERRYSNSTVYWNNNSKSGKIFLTSDLNRDAKVDIFDYNTLVSKFGNPYTIFDYNLLIANFGKEVLN